VAALTRQVEALREYARLAWLRFDEGYSSYLEVTYSQNLLYNAELIRTFGESVSDFAILLMLVSRDRTDAKRENIKEAKPMVDTIFSSQ
jgi:hypothetical protein